MPIAPFTRHVVGNEVSMWLEKWFAKCEEVKADEKRLSLHWYVFAHHPGAHYLSIP